MKTQIYLAASLLSLAALNTRAQDPWIANINYPMDTNACVGAAVSFRVIANTTNPPMTIQWLHEGTNLFAATNALLIISNLTADHAGGFMAWVSNSIGGFTNSRTATLTVHPAQFADVTVSAGVTNAPGYCLSAAWGDFDNDQDIDLYLANGGNTSGTNALLRNNGNGTFTRVGAEAGPITTDRHDSQGCAWIDFNNDGHRDMFVNNGGWALSRNDLYWNNGGGTFRRGNVGNLTELSQARGWSACADYDGDGWVDIYVPEGTSASGPFAPRLYHANPDGNFTYTSLGPTVGYANAGVWGDYDNDGDPDLYACNAFSPSTLWRNNGKGQFTPVSNGLSTSAQIVHGAWADYDRDGDLDMALCTWRTENEARIYRNEGASGFVLVRSFPGSIGWPAWADYDNDGWTDLLVTGGQGTPLKPALYHNNGDGTFSKVVDIFTEAADNSLTCPWGDYDNDGFMDVILTHQYGQHRLYRNLGNTNHWIKIKLAGTASNRDAIGAKVRVQATIAGQSVWQMQEVNGGYAMQNDTRLNFGLGDATIVDWVRIEWPSGNVQELSAQSVDRIVPVTEQVNITPVRPTASLNGSVTLTRSFVSGATYQWRFDGVDLVGQTSRILTLTNLTADMAGRYSVVASNATTLITNFVYLRVDSTFEKITGQPIVEDREASVVGAWCDYDSDGYVDLFVANSMDPAPKNSLYHNERNGTFGRVTNALTTVAMSTFGSLWGDYDNDGAPDLLTIPALGSASLLYHNDGQGIFTRVLPVPFSGSSQVDGAWADMDGDGLLDLLICTFNNQPDLAFRNLGGGQFQKLTTNEVGAVVADSASNVSPSFADFDNDGDPDLYVSCESGPALLYRNRGDGLYQKVQLGSLPGTSSTLGGVWGDFNNDGYFDLVTTARSGLCKLHMSVGGATFQDVTTTAGLAAPAGPVWGPAWGDFDNDGDLDLFIPYYNSTNILFQNNGDGTFTSLNVGSPLQEGFRDECAVWVDYDNDGFLDLFVVCGEASPSPNLLYRNNLSATGNTNRWLKVLLKGTASNAMGIGAKIRVRAVINGKTTWQVRQIASNGFATGSELLAHFGLGNAAIASTVRIEWPSGAVQELQNVAVNQMLTVCEPPALCATVHADCSCELTIKAEPNRVWQVQASSDLLNWQTLATVTNLTYQFQYNDPDAANHTSRFYRVKGH